MRTALALSVLLMSSSLAFAGCYGSDSFYTCNDTTGNRYTVQKFGNQTTVRGFNSDTGSTWSQNSTRLGNTTYTKGFDADGNSWNMQQRRIGNSTYTSGFDSDGNYFSQTCGAFGCQ
jgi:hypothetical protein